VRIRATRAGGRPLLLGHQAGAGCSITCPARAAAAARGELAFGTIDSWLLWQLTEGRVHATDVSNASRTMMFDIRSGRWSPELLQMLGVPGAVLPEVLPSSHVFGETRLFGAPIPVCGIAGDQQAALFGQACFEAGLAKNTYGTGCFMLMHTGSTKQESKHGLVATAAAQTDATPAYALEGSVFVAGAVVQWLRDGLQAIREQRRGRGARGQRARHAAAWSWCRPSPAWARRTGMPRHAASSPASRAAARWRTSRARRWRASRSRARCCSGHAGRWRRRTALRELRVDGGACTNDTLMQFQADLLGLPVLRPKVTETTALGAACLAGLAAGVWRGQAEVARLWQAERCFDPAMSRDEAASRMAAWNHAVQQAMA
jgi:glycerol kinase